MRVDPDWLSVRSEAVAAPFLNITLPSDVPPSDPASTLMCALVSPDVPARSLSASACACLFTAVLAAADDDGEPLPDDEHPATAVAQASRAMRRRRTSRPYPAPPHMLRRETGDTTAWLR